MRMRVFFLTMLLLSAVSCDTSIDLFSEEVKQAVVNGVFCSTDSIHFIRIQKTFQTANTSEFTMDDHDLYFDSVNVQILGISNDEVIWTNTLIKTPWEKDSGRFPYENHYLYIFDSSFIVYNEISSNVYPDIERLRIDIEFVELGIRSIAESNLLGPTKISLGRYESKQISCYGDNISEIKLEFKSNRLYSSYDEFYSEIGMKFFISEIISGITYHDSIVTISNNPDLSTGGYPLYPERIFNRILQGVNKDKNVTSRRLDSIHFFSTIPDNVFANYWNTRIHRADHDYLPYSNFDNENVFGMFFCISKGYETGFYLDKESLDSLCSS